MVGDYRETVYAGHHKIPAYVNSAFVTAYIRSVEAQVRQQSQHGEEGWGRSLTPAEELSAINRFWGRDDHCL